MYGTTQAFVIDATGPSIGVAETGTATVSGVGSSVEIVMPVRRICVQRRLRGGTPLKGVQKLTVTYECVPRRQEQK